jgi:DNA-binding transcriptional MocR family regulator
MPRPPATSREELERVAMLLFSEHGFDATTVDDIAAAAGIGRRTFFRYFGSKNDVVWGRFAEGLADLRASLAAAPDDVALDEALRQAIVATKAAGKTIKFLYTIPNFHNPAGVTMSLARRAEILDICRTEGVLVLEDNPYGLLGFDSEPMRALRADEAEGVVYLGSFSKTFSPGMRVGWALAPHAVREKLVLAQESATLCPPAFNQMAVSAYLAQHDWQGQIKQMREMYRERRDAMIEALQDFMPAACQWNVPHGGFFVWMTLPPGIDAKAMLPRAVTARVAYVPGTAFFADGFGAGSMRLSFCYPTPERIREGVRRLAGVLEEEMELRETFGATQTPHLPRSGYDGPGTDLS